MRGLERMSMRLLLVLALILPACRNKADDDLDTGDVGTTDATVDETSPGDDGTTGLGELERLIETKAESGVFLTALGFGSGNYQDDTLELLANRGNELRSCILAARGLGLLLGR